MFGMNFTRKINNLFKFEKRNFSFTRGLKGSVSRNKADEQTIEVLNLLKRKVSFGFLLSAKAAETNDSI